MATSARLRELLELESYPHLYTHKFIGHNTDAFLAALVELEVLFPKARRVGHRESGNGQQGGRYLALTYELPAESVDEIVALIDATGELVDLKLIL
jgi:putative lipoic acid-binding regulatory protein